MLNIIEKNILDVTEGVILHQCNAQGAFGSGMAGQIAKKWPQVRESYLQAIKDEITLGEIDIVLINEDLLVANCIGQEFYGYDKKRYTDYDAVRNYCNYMGILNNKAHRQLYIPYMIGCGLGGGDWDIVSKIIEEELPEAIICKLPKKV